ncbi:unnamed protein product [Porites lobata]|uniref:Uncharacterized protein n=1 Tax=Porites lobata TaxID=104759 RepID=A0ABN8RS93_9CNID|nr:unnamed protein product [Porites lobata]
MDVPQVPGGDTLAAIDNDQVLIKKWTVRKDNQAQISVLTSVCKSEEDKVLKLLDMCSASEDNKGLICHEVKAFR